MATPINGKREGEYLPSPVVEKKMKVDNFGETKISVEIPLEVDQRIATLFKGLTIPRSEIRLLEDDKSFQQKVANEWARIAAQVSKTDPEVIEKFQIAAKHSFVAKKVMKHLSLEDPIFVTLKGLNHANEDRFLSFTVLMQTPRGLETAKCLALFDGHGGAYAADFCKSVIQPTLESCLKEFNVLGNDFEVANTMTMAFVKLDAIFRELKYQGGCTACLALICGNKLYAASAGDSRILLYPQGYPCIQMNFDFKASDPYAVKTVSHRGGEIVNSRVNGILAITRGIGNEFLRKNDQKSISPRPKITVLDLNLYENATNLWLMLATDGLTDVLTSTVAATTIDDLYALNLKPKEISERFVKAARFAGSGDDITVGIINIKEFMKS